MKQFEIEQTFSHQELRQENQALKLQAAYHEEKIAHHEEEIENLKSKLEGYEDLKSNQELMQNQLDKIMRKIKWERLL